MWNPEVLEPIVQCAHATPVRSKAPVRQAVVCVEYLEGYYVHVSAAPSWTERLYSWGTPKCSCPLVSMSQAQSPQRCTKLNLHWAVVLMKGTAPYNPAGIVNLWWMLFTTPLHCVWVGGQAYLPEVSLSTLFFEVGSLSESRTYHFSETGWPEVPWDPFVSAPSLYIVSMNYKFNEFVLGYRQMTSCSAFI